MKIIGIDQSINSTGICVRQDSKTRYYIVHADSSLSKKARQFFEDHPKSWFKHLYYPKQQPVKTSSYSDKEQAKAFNISAIGNLIEQIIKKEKPDLVQLEGVSYSSNGNVVDLAGLNYVIRYILTRHQIPFKVISPSELKKRATGNGSAEKAEMIYVWLACDPKMREFESCKIDDVADAYFLTLTE